MLIKVPCSACGTSHHVAPRVSSLRCSNCNTRTTVPARTFRSPDLRRFGRPQQQQQSHPPPAAGLRFEHPFGPKRAVVCGITYQGTPTQLDGCVRDADLVKLLLKERFGFPESSILLLTDDGVINPRKIPTKENIRRALRWLVEGCQPGDSLVFHFSGHGGQQKDADGDEVDGFDETIYPLDFQEEGEIVDDEINEVIVRPLPHGAKLHAVIDACHSGTVMDLPYLCRMNRSGQYEWEYHRPRNGSWKGTNGGEAISFSGCDDHQCSSDSVMITDGITSAGALTYSFVEAIRSGGQMLTYGGLLNSMRRLIRTAHNRGPNSTTPFKLDDGYRQILMQEPQLTSNEEFDVYKKSFSL